MTRSIQSRLAWSLMAAAVILSAGVGVLLYHWIGREMVDNFDRGLRGKGEAIVSLVSLEAGGVLDFEFNEAAMPEYRPGKSAEYFQIRFADGKPYVTSKSLADGALPLQTINVSQRASYFDFPLPDGRPGRAIQISFIPQSEQPPPAPAAPMVAVIGRDRSELDRNLSRLFTSLAIATILLGSGTALTSIPIVRYSLRPLRRFAEQAARIDAKNLETRITQIDLPAELFPIRQRLNDLLGRLEEAFNRERRFTSNVAHELRTPIAELRSITEIAIQWPDTQSDRQAIADSFAIAVQMQTLVNTLLSLVRTGSAEQPIVLQPVKLWPIINETLARLSKVTALRQIDCDIPEEIIAIAEPVLLNSVLTNLFQNASEYATGSDAIRCTAQVKANSVHLTIENEAANLTDDDIPHLFEPFWRHDRSRTGHQHAGLGLSLVRAYCDLMQIDLCARLHQSTLQISLTCAQAKIVASHAEQRVIAGY